MLFLNLWEIFKIYSLKKRGTIFFFCKLDIFDGFTFKKRGKEIDAFRDRLEVRWEDGLDQPNYECHIDENEYSWGSFEDDIQEDIKGILVSIILFKSLLHIIIRFPPHIINKTYL